ncbi:MAG: ABC transporter ATP-binding protein [Desulfohalobiaceae bacterium]
MSVLNVAGLKKVYGSGDLAFMALTNIDFSVQSGELAALLGPSGSGKSTLLNCISLILEPTAGRIEMGGKTVYADSRMHVPARRFRRQNIGFIFQGSYLIPFLNVLDNVCLAMELNGRKGKQARERGMELLRYLEMAHRSKSLPGKLSGGETQRVAIARALANNPRLILADEPTASLDTAKGLKVMELLKTIALERQAAVITVTHDERMIQGFDSVYRLQDGSFQTAKQSNT